MALSKGCSFLVVFLYVDVDFLYDLLLCFFRLRSFQEKLSFRTVWKKDKNTSYHNLLFPFLCTHFYDCFFTVHIIFATSEKCIY